MSRVFFIVCLCLSLSISSPIFAGEQAFTQNTIAQLKAQYHGKNWLMLLWSVDCPPCFKELAVVQRLSTQYPDIPLVVINADGDADIYPEMKEVVQQFELTKLDTYYFTDGQTEKSRYHIDPQWFGELPRSYFFNEQGESQSRSGLVSKKLISGWLGLK